MYEMFDAFYKHVDVIIKAMNIIKSQIIVNITMMSIRDNHDFDKKICTLSFAVIKRNQTIFVYDKFETIFDRCRVRAEIDCKFFEFE